MDKDSIFYTPDIKPKREYYSEKDFEDLEEELELGIDSKDEIHDDSFPNNINKEILSENIDRVIDLIEFIPGGVGGSINDILDGMSNILDNSDIDFEELNKPDIEYVYPDEDIDPPIIDTPEKDKGDKELDPQEEYPYDPERDDWKRDPNEIDNYRNDYDFELEDNNPVLRVVVDDMNDEQNKYINQHNLHIAQIFSQYLKRMNNILSEYFTRTIYMLDLDSGQSLKYLLGEYTLSSDDIKNPNLKHLSDTIIKNQIVNKQNYLLFNKMFNKKEFQKHLRYCKMAALSRERYHNIEYEDSSSIDSIVMDSILSKERISSDIKYKNSFKSLYKFLNSQIDILEDILKATTETLSSKAILMREEREGIELATEEELTIARYINLVEKEYNLRQERESKLLQRQKEREERNKIQQNVE